FREEGSRRRGCAERVHRGVLRGLSRKIACGRERRLLPRRLANKSGGARLLALNLSTDAHPMEFLRVALGEGVASGRQLADDRGTEWRGSSSAASARSRH